LIGFQLPDDRFARAEGSPAVDVGAGPADRAGPPQADTNRGG
jgi:hypothetical protein